MICDCEGLQQAAGAGAGGAAAGGADGGHLPPLPEGAHAPGRGAPRHLQGPPGQGTAGLLAPSLTICTTGENTIALPPPPVGEYCTGAIWGKFLGKCNWKINQKRGNTVYGEINRKMYKRAVKAKKVREDLVSAHHKVGKMSLSKGRGYILGHKYTLFLHRVRWSSLLPVNAFMWYLHIHIWMVNWQQSSRSSCLPSVLIPDLPTGFLP